MGAQFLRFSQLPWVPGHPCVKRKIIRETEKLYFFSNPNKRDAYDADTHRVFKDKRDGEYHLEPCPMCPDSGITAEDRCKMFPFVI